MAELRADDLDGWRLLAARPDPGVLPPWAAQHLDTLAELEQHAALASRGRILVHGDVRGDNLLIEGGRAVLVDWPMASVGAAFFDVVAAAPSVAMQGGPPPHELVGMTRAGAQVQIDQLLPVVTAVTGYFVERAQQPPPPGLPTVRAFQAAQANAALPWLHDCLRRAGRLGERKRRSRPLS